ncbi:MAG: OmpA family protein [Muribaculaceae bacterium]|nr:OmpA family protein [Muribaculaceae bacterium]MDE5843882.1 OmpA family protein [Muribaculaceae bacterium]MDE7369770.1 OmpA family protein [Muribaculaceae bacterium]
MAGKIKVYGKAQNRTALGIAHAYVVMYPHATLEDLRKAFPNEICPDKGVSENFLIVEEAEKFNDKMSLYFAKPDEVIELQDGSKVALAQVWSKPSFDRMVEQGKLYDIEVAEFEKAMKGEKGGYRLEYLNGYVPPVPVATKRSLPWWIWLILALVVAGIIAAICMPRGEKVVEVEKIVEVRDTVYIQQIEDIEANFNAAQFEQGKADLNDDAKLALHDLAKILKQNPELKLRIEGHTSAEGDADVNQKLSEARAQAAVEFLVNKEGIDANQLEAVGMGSSKLKNPENPTSDENRRTEFEIL